VKAGLPLLATDGPLALAAAAAVPGAETRARIERLLLGWRGSDRSLLPFLEWAETAGLADFAARVREKRHMAARAITANSGKVEAHELPRIFLTRATLLRLRREAKGLDQALRGEIPVAIQKARELGDLRENAEYESAKLKQRQTQARLAQLGARLANVSVIDDLDRPPGVAGLGTEVELELPDGGSRRLWILGEGDDRLGPEVVSYLAPLGRALLGKRPGDAVELPGDGAAHSAVVRAVRPRLPEPGDPAAGSAAPTAA
jgi:transcription elongation factor GreA